MKKVAVFASGWGSNFEQLCKAEKSGILPAHIALLIAGKPAIGAIEIAQLFNIAHKVFNKKEFASPAPVFPKESFLSYNSEIVPNKYELKQNYPNPFNPVTHIQFGLPIASDAFVRVYNTQDQQVAELINGFQQAGTYEVVFDASGLASGLYFYRLEAGTFQKVKRMLLVK